MEIIKTILQPFWQETSYNNQILMYFSLIRLQSSKRNQFKNIKMQKVKKFPSLITEISVIDIAQNAKEKSNRSLDAPICQQRAAKKLSK